MAKKETRIVNKLKKYLSQGLCDDGYEFIQYLRENISDISYDALLSQKIIWKICICDTLSADAKDEIYSVLINEYSTEKVHNLIMFMTHMWKSEKKNYNIIYNNIKKSFSSMFSFLCSLNLFVQYKGNCIRAPKDLLIHAALDVFGNTLTIDKSIDKIIIPEHLIESKLSVLNYIYEIAIQIGALHERLDSICYLYEEVLDVNTDDNKPIFQIRMKNYDHSFSVMLGSAYYQAMRKEDSISKDIVLKTLYDYYKCYICKKCTILCIPEDVKEWIQGAVKRQLLSRTFLDYLICLRWENNIPSFVTSILLLIYIENLFLLFSSNQGIGSISLNEIRKNCCFSNKIDDSDFEKILEILKLNTILGEKYNDRPYFRSNDQVILLTCMINWDYCIFEDMKNLVLDSKKPYMGKAIDTFGKNVLEKVVQVEFKRAGWNVLEKSINVKSTDFDLVAYNNGIVILGQVKAAHTGRTPFQLWKSWGVIEKACEQINNCKEAIDSDPNLLFSNLKREHIVSSRTQIQKILYCIIAGNSYFSLCSAYPVLCIEDITNVLEFGKEFPDKFEECLLNPLLMYDIKEIPEMHISWLDFPDLEIYYQDLEETKE